MYWVLNAYSSMIKLTRIQFLQQTRTVAWPSALAIAATPSVWQSLNHSSGSGDLEPSMQDSELPVGDMSGVPFSMYIEHLHIQALLPG